MKNKVKASESILIGWLMWAVAALFYSLDYFQHTAPSVLIKPIAQSLHISFISVGNIMSIYFPIYAISQLPAGYLLDRYGCKLVLTIACLIVSSGLLLMLIPQESMLVIGRILIAIGSAFAFLGALKTASDWLSTKIFPIAVGLTNTIGVLGGILGQSFLNHLILKYDWMNAVRYVGWFGLLLAVLIFFFLRSYPRDKAASIKKYDLSAIRDKNIWLLALYAGIMVGTVVNAFSELYDVVFLQTNLGVNSQTAALISSMVFIGIAIGGPTHGLIARAFKQRRHWMLIACAATITLFSLIMLSGSLHWPVQIMYILYLGVGFFVSSMLLAFSSARCCYDKSVHATIFALLNMVIGICGFAFQFIVGEVMELVKIHLPHSTLNFEFLVGFIVLLVPLALSWLLCFFTKRV